VPRAGTKGLFKRTVHFPRQLRRDDDASEIDCHYGVVASFSARSLQENAPPAGL
jgi:hypothetical protein